MYVHTDTCVFVFASYSDINKLPKFLFNDMHDFLSCLMSSNGNIAAQATVNGGRHAPPPCPLGCVWQP